MILYKLNINVNPMLKPTSFKRAGLKRAETSELTQIREEWNESPLPWCLTQSSDRRSRGCPSQPPDWVCSHWLELLYSRTPAHHRHSSRCQLFSHSLHCPPLQQGVEVLYGLPVHTWPAAQHLGTKRFAIKRNCSIIQKGSQHYLYCRLNFFTIRKQKKEDRQSLNSFKNSQNRKKTRGALFQYRFNFNKKLWFCCFVELFVYQDNVAIPHQNKDPQGPESGKEGTGTPYPVLQAPWRREAATRRWRLGRTAGSQLCPAYRSRGCTPPPPHPHSPPAAVHFSCLVFFSC